MLDLCSCLLSLTVFWMMVLPLAPSPPTYFGVLRAVHVSRTSQTTGFVSAVIVSQHPSSCVVTRKKEVTESFLSQLFSDGRVASSQPTVAPLEHGRLHEDDAVKEYVSAMHFHGKAGLKVFRCGLCVHPLHSFIAASPDRIVYDPSVDPMHGLLEVKCPLRLFDDYPTTHDACIDIAGFCCSLQGGKVSLKPSHPYYFQVQGQIAVCGLSWCDFLIWVGPGRISVQRTFFDEDFRQFVIPPCLIDFFRIVLSPIFCVCYQQFLMRTLSDLLLCSALSSHLCMLMRVAFQQDAWQRQSCVFWARCHIMLSVLFPHFKV